MLCAQDRAGLETFENRCSGCHGSDGNGGELGPNIAVRMRRLSDEQVRNTVLHGVPGRMPANNIDDGEMPKLIAYLRTLRPHLYGFQPYRVSAKLSNGETLTGLILNESFDDAQIRTDDNRFAPQGKGRHISRGYLRARLADL
jgi:alcohol dehydrogenase (cytochrome c)